jgi:hypothetical protein
MDNQFKTLTSSYHDNYIQYKVTGNQSYQNSFLSAEEGIKKIISSLQDEVNSNTEQINTFYNSDVEGKLRDSQSKIRLTQKNLAKDKDREIEASIRNSSIASPKLQIPTSYMISIGVLTGAVLLLSVLG